MDVGVDVLNFNFIFILFCEDKEFFGLIGEEKMGVSEKDNLMVLVGILVGKEVNVEVIFFFFSERWLEGGFRWR